MCQASSVKLIGFLALQHTFSLFQKKMYWKMLQKTYQLQTRKQNSLTFHWLCQYQTFYQPWKIHFYLTFATLYVSSIVLELAWSQTHLIWNIYDQVTITFFTITFLMRKRYRNFCIHHYISRISNKTTSTHPRIFVISLSLAVTLCTYKIFQSLSNYFGQKKESPCRSLSLVTLLPVDQSNSDFPIISKAVLFT